MDETGSLGDTLEALLTQREPHEADDRPELAHRVRQEGLVVDHQQARGNSQPVEGNIQPDSIQACVSLMRNCYQSITNHLRHLKSRKLDKLPTLESGHQVRGGADLVPSLPVSPVGNDGIVGISQEQNSSSLE